MSSGASLSGARRPTRARTATSCARRRSCWRLRGGRTRRSPRDWASRARLSRSGEDGSVRRGCRGLRRDRGRVGRGVFPPAQVAEVKALACECRPSRRRALALVQRELPGRRSSAGSSRRSRRSRSGAGSARTRSAPGTTARGSSRATQLRREGRRHPGSLPGRWEGQLLEPGDYVVCADEKPSIQARARKHPSLPAAPGGDGQLVCMSTSARERSATWPPGRPPRQAVYRCAPEDGIVPFDQLVEQFMSVEPYSTAQRVFVIADNGSAHRGQRSIDRLKAPGRTCASSTPRSTQAAQPSRDLLLRRPAQGAAAQQLPRPHTLEQTLLRSPPLRADRPAVRVEVHPQTSPPRPRTTRPTQTGPPTRRMNPKPVNELRKTTT